MRSRQTHIFATRSDLIPGLAAAESELDIAYIRSDGLRADSSFKQIASLLDWEGLGRNSTGNHTDGYRFLIVSKDLRIKAKRRPQKVGGTRYAVDQGLNPDSVSFLPGGIYNDQQILVCGHIGTASDSTVSIALYKAFVRLVTKISRRSAPIGWDRKPCGLCTKVSGW